LVNETDKTKATYHGAPMKAVDILVELDTTYLFVEVKHYEHLEELIIGPLDDHDTLTKKRDHHTWLKNYLKYKFRDSYLYRHAEGKTEKPIHYLCLLNFDNALNLAINKNLRKELPIGKPVQRWQKKLCESCQVLNETAWNIAFPRWPVRN